MPPRILAVRFSSMGDVILVTPLLRALRRRHPQAQITMVTRAEYAPLFQQNPHLTEVIAWDPTTPLRALASRLRAGRYTHRLDLHGSLRSRALRVLVPGRWRGYPKRVLARAVLIRTKRDVFRDRRHVVERYFDAARGLDTVPDDQPPEVFVHRDAAAAADRFLAGHGIGQSRRLVAVVPGAAHFTKRWPERHWVDLVAALVSEGSDAVVLGGQAEAEIGARLVRTGPPHVASAAGVMDLQGTAALLRRARQAVAGDTGVMHLATAVGTPVTLLLGPTVGAFGFLPWHGRATIIQRDLPCRPCSRMGGPRCPLGHHDCLVGITPAQVSESLRKVPR